MNKASSNEATKPAAIKKCFVIGRIGSEGTPERKLADMFLKGMIKPAFEGHPNLYHVKRADEDARPGTITDHIINDILHADLIVSDLTGLNPNALYELGIAHMAQKPTIPIALVGTVLPFDNMAQRAIFVDAADFDSMANAQVRIRDAVAVIEQPGYVVSNPVTLANATYKLLSSSDPMGQIIASMQSQIAGLERRLELQVWEREAAPFNSTTYRESEASNDFMIRDYRASLLSFGKRCFAPTLPLAS